MGKVKEKQWLMLLLLLSLSLSFVVAYFFVGSGYREEKTAREPEGLLGCHVTSGKVSYKLKVT